MSTTIQIRTDAEVKAAADSIFNRLGITMSDGMNIFLRQVIRHGGFPFEVKIENTLENSKVVSSTQPRSLEERIEYYKHLPDTFKGCSFSTERYFEMKEEEKQLEEQNYQRM
jgi:DNA-damage-inducible protein J